MQKFQFPFCDEYNHSVEFKTTVVRHFDGSEQRQALWLNPKRTFGLNFESESSAKAALEEFFNARKGDFESFLWRWDEAHSGSGLDYTCFFDSPKLAQNILPLGYSKSSVTLVAIDDGNILKGRYFDRPEFWTTTENITLDGSKATYNGISSLSQAGVLTLGESYQLRLKIQGTQGLAPNLSALTSDLPMALRQFTEGDNTLDFIAIGTDLKLETASATSGNILEVALIKRPKPYPVFDFVYNVEHQNEVFYITLKDEEFTWQNARYSVRENPLRRWVLTLELTPSEAIRFDAFFIGQKGRYRTFSWEYDGETKTVRFDTDKLDQKQYPLGYREVKIPIIEVAQ